MNTTQAKTDARPSGTLPDSAPSPGTGQLPGALERMRIELRRRFWRLLVPPVVVLFGVEAARFFGMFDSLKYVDHPTWDVVLFVIAALFAFALPILYRVLFARSHRGRQSVAFAALFRFERSGMGLALYAPWVAVAASLIAVQGELLYGIDLMALYACYVFYPSRRRLLADARIFRVRVPQVSDEKIRETGAWTEDTDVRMEDPDVKTED